MSKDPNRRAAAAFLVRPRSLVEISDAGDLLGMDVLFEPEHQWIAEEYLATDVPEGWVACLDQSTDKVYYWNETTNVRAWACLGTLCGCCTWRPW